MKKLSAEIASRDATIKELQEENANNYGLHKIVNKCGMHLFPLMPDPELGQNVAVIAGYIDIYRTRIEKLEKGLRELRNEAYGMLSAFPEVADVISNTNYNVLMRKVEAASAALEEGKE